MYTSNDVSPEDAPLHCHYTHSLLVSLRSVTPSNNEIRRAFTSLTSQYSLPLMLAACCLHVFHTVVLALICLLGRLEACERQYKIDLVRRLRLLTLPAKQTTQPFERFKQLGSANCKEELWLLDRKRLVFFIRNALVPAENAWVRVCV